MVTADVKHRDKYIVWGSDDKRDWIMLTRVDTLSWALDEANDQPYQYTMVTSDIIFKNFDLPKEL